MRFVKTFVLRLFVDSNAPERVCGDVRFLEERMSHPFKNVGELEDLLHHYVKKLLQSRSPRPLDSQAGK